MKFRIVPTVGEHLSLSFPLQNRTERARFGKKWRTTCKQESYQKAVSRRIVCSNFLHRTKASPSAVFLVLRSTLCRSKHKAAKSLSLTPQRCPPDLATCTPHGHWRCISRSVGREKSAMYFISRGPCWGINVCFVEMNVRAWGLLARKQRKSLCQCLEKSRQVADWRREISDL